MHSVSVVTASVKCSLRFLVHTITSFDVKDGMQWQLEFEINLILFKFLTHVEYDPFSKHQ